MYQLQRFLPAALCGLLALLPHSTTAQTPDPEAARIMRDARAAIPRVRQGAATLTVRDATGQPLAGVRVHLNQVTQDFFFGALSDAIFTDKFSPAETERFKALYLDLFNGTVAKVYWTPFEPKPGEPEWRQLDAFLEWCHAAKLSVRGHPLAWTHPAGTPTWLVGRPERETTALLEARVRSLVHRYAGTIDQWDVVNEPVHTVPWSVAMRDAANTDGAIAEGARYDMRGVRSEDIVAWVDPVYRWAAESNPKGHYVLNEFFLMAKEEERRKFIALVRTLLARGVPVRGLGIQAHEPRDLWFSPQQVRATLDELGALGLPLHISEFIPQSSGQAIQGGHAGSWTPEAQADFAEQIYVQAFAHPAVASITWWGFSDRDIWLPGGGLVDAALQPKPVYQRLRDLVRRQWMTHDLNLVTDADGRVQFRGFYGIYDVRLEHGQTAPILRQVHLSADATNAWDLRL